MTKTLAKNQGSGKFVVALQVWIKPDLTYPNGDFMELFVVYNKRVNYLCYFLTSSIKKVMYHTLKMFLYVQMWCCSKLQRIKNYKRPWKASPFPIELRWLHLIFGQKAHNNNVFESSAVHIVESSNGISISAYT